MPVKLIKLTKRYKRQLIEMIDEWKLDQEQNNTDRSPYAIFKNSYEDFDYYLENLSSDKPKNGWVPNSVFFLYDKSRNKLLGAVDIRHRLNRRLLKTGGHIGDGIRPSERGKGYGKRIIQLALEECVNLGINKVLVCVNKNNIPSKKAILANGGIYKNTVIDEDGEEIERYWIDAPKQLLLKHIKELHMSDDETALRLKDATGLYKTEIISEVKYALTSFRRYSKIRRNGGLYVVQFREVEYTINSRYAVIDARVITAN